MNDNQLSKLIILSLYESLKTQKDKYSEDKINSIKELDPSKPKYKYIDAIQKFIYVDNTDKDDVKTYIDIYNNKLNKNLVDNDHRDINKFKTFDEFKDYVQSLEDVKSNTEIKKQNRSIINDQYIKNIYTDYGKYAGTYDVYIPYNMKQSIELQGRNTKWCTQIPDKDKNQFNQYRFEDDITLYYFINKDGYNTMITNHEQTKKYKQTVMFQIQVTKNSIYKIFNNNDKEINEQKLYQLSGIKQSDYKWQILPDGHYDVNIKGKRLIYNYKNSRLDGEYISYYDNGNINIKEYYKNGLLDGEYISYYYNGNIFIKQHYKDGKHDGEYIEYYGNGNIFIKQYYTDDKYNGEYIEYWNNGNMQIKQNYKDDKYDGEYIKYYGNGNIFIKQYYTNNKYNGTYIEYWNNGNKKLEQHYKNNILDDKWIEIS